MKSMPWEDMLTGQNAIYIMHLYQKYQADPQSVDHKWQQLFAQESNPDSIDSVLQAHFHNTEDFGWDNKSSSPSKMIPNKKPSDSLTLSQDTNGQSGQDLWYTVQALRLIRAYRLYGHTKAQLDPLNLTPLTPHPELDLDFYELTLSDLSHIVTLDERVRLPSPIALNDLIDLLNQLYCGPLTAEYKHIDQTDARLWVRHTFEGGMPTPTPEHQQWICDQLCRAENFESFLSKKFQGAKRFGLEGLESLIPALETILETSATEGVDDVVLGMAHRGRLNVLAHILDVPYASILSDFEGTATYTNPVPGSGDVKYHLGASVDRDIKGHKVHISLTPNPSHLEAVNPVALGKVRAKQDKGAASMGILLHGDAAFPGQGVVAETLLLSRLDGYQTGGTIHIITNNQVGFTTNPDCARSSRYPSDLAKIASAPIIHVNADDPEAVCYGASLAAQFRARFHQDVVLHLVGYRRNGHNESDEPAFTQPLMYQTIKQHPSVFAGYLKRHSHLIDNTADRLAQLNANHELAKNTYEKQLDWLSGAWNGLDHQDTNPPTTGIAGQDLQALGALLTQIPASFDLNRKIARQLTQKNTMLADGKGIDWALAESLAFATIIKEGKNVRLSGQDVGRGTFSHRHAVWTCQTSGHYHTPLQTCGTGKANIVNSPLSEWAVLSFEYGYTTAAPHDLVLWEAQFGDFANGAQVPIDQFISSGATKWFRLSGLIMLLPHGYEGQGPEHSSARLERFLQLCAEDNMRVVHITTPANYFHALRRQIIHKDRRPLISMSPKYLLRHKACVSDLTEFDKGTQFQPVLSDPDVVSGAIKANDIKHIVLCTGKVFYDLYDARAAKNAYDHAIIRLEEIYPFPTQELATHLATFTKAQSITWAQEEPQNMGAWSFVDRLIEDTCADIKALKNNRPRYAGRPAAASPAVGTLKAHQQQQNQFMSDVFDVT